MGVGWGVELIYLIKKVSLMYGNGENGGRRGDEELSVKHGEGEWLCVTCEGLCVCQFNFLKKRRGEKIALAAQS